MDALPPSTGSCHGGPRDDALGRGESAGKSAVLDRLASDYPQGPHDQPQSMCPAFGSLRVGLRMRRVATILCGSACCVYGLTFTSHFYGARRTVGYVPFNSETLVRGQLYEDIRDAVYATGQAGRSGRDRGDQPVRADRVGRAAGPAAKADRRRARDRDRRAGLRRADPCGSQGRAGRRHAALRPARGRAGPGGAAAHQHRRCRRSPCHGRDCFPADPPGHRRDAGPDGPRAWRRPRRPASGATCTARSTAPSSAPCIRSIPPRSASSPRLPAGRSSAPARSGSRAPRRMARGDRPGRQRSVRPARCGPGPRAAGDPRRARGEPDPPRASRSRATRAPSC